MRGDTKDNIRVHPRSSAAVLCAWLAVSLSAQTHLTLEQATSRLAPDWTPIYDGKLVAVSGEVSAAPLPGSNTLYLPIQDQASHGLLLAGSELQFRDLAPGDWVEAAGTIALRTGMPVLIPQSIRRLRHAAPPSAKAVRPEDLATFRYLGVLVATEGILTRPRQNGGDVLVSIGDRGSSIDVVLGSGRPAGKFGFHLGDRVRVTGIASQSCSTPPYNRFFQILVPSLASIAVEEKSWMIPPPFLLGSLLIAGVLLAIWWFRERRMAALRHELRVLNTLGEDVIAASSPADVLRRLESQLPKVSNSTGIGMYLYNRGTRSLDSVHGGGAVMESIELDNPQGAMARGIAACFRNRMLLAIPDTRRSPFIRKEESMDIPRSVIFVPMFAQTELVGVIEMHNSEKLRYYSDGEQAALQHLANQVATALKLQEQQTVQEQLFRSEKLAAAGKLISEVANELRLPLESILARASALRSRPGEDSRDELALIAAQAQRAAQIVARLDTLAKVEQTELQAVDLSALLNGLLQFREPECKAKGVEIRTQLAGKPTTVMGVPGQLEQVLLNLLVDAEKSAAEAREKVVSVSSSLLAHRVLVEIAYATRSAEFQNPAEGEASSVGALALGACRGILQSHGGEFRAARNSPVQARFDVELPVVEPRSTRGPGGPPIPGHGRQFTILVVDPDAKVQRQVLRVLGDRGDRVVPVSNAEEGLDLIQRMRFDIAFCTVRLAGLNWVEFFNRVRYQVGCFVLLTDGFDTDLARAFQGGEGFVLSKPIDDSELLRICQTVGERVGNQKPETRN